MRGPKKSVIGGLLGVVLSEAALNLGKYLGGNDINPEFRLYFSSLGYSFGSISSSIFTASTDSQYTKLEGVHAPCDLKPILKDMALMFSNSMIPLLYAIHLGSGPNTPYLP